MKQETLIKEMLKNLPESILHFRPGFRHQQIFNTSLNICIYITRQICSSEWVSLSLFVSNKRQNGWTDRAKIFSGTSRDPREEYGWSNFQKFACNKIRLLKIRELFVCFLFVLQCKQREHVHNWNSRWTRSALKA